MKKIILVLGAIILGVGIYIWMASDRAAVVPEKSDGTSSSAEGIPAGWEVYTDQERGFSLALPGSYETKQVQGNGAPLFYVYNPSAVTEKSSGNLLSVSLANSMPNFLPYQKATTQPTMVNEKIGKRFTYLSDMGAGIITQYVFEIPAGFLYLTYELYTPEAIATAEGIIATLRY